MKIITVYKKENMASISIKKKNDLIIKETNVKNKLKFKFVMILIIFFYF